MDSKRALEIFNGKENIEVHYNDTPVWIEGISGLDGQNAEIRYVSNNKTFYVPVNELNEKNPSISGD